MTIDTDAALRALDAAPATMTPAEHQRAGATLERILATQPSTAKPTATAVSSTRRHLRRLVLLPAAAAALAVGALVVPGLGGQSAAYASWSAVPGAVAASDLGSVEAACQKHLRGSDTTQTARLVLAERRGDFVTLLYHSDTHDVSAACVAGNPQGTTDVTDVNTAVGSSDGPALKAPARGYTQDTIAQFGSPQPASVTDGAVGQDVKGVTIHAGSRTVTATVDDGRYVAWWPGAAFEEGASKPDGEGGPAEILTYDLTLTDGTTIQNAQPYRPS